MGMHEGYQVWKVTRDIKRGSKFRAGTEVALGSRGFALWWLINWRGVGCRCVWDKL